MKAHKGYICIQVKECSLNELVTICNDNWKYKKAIDGLDIIGVIERLHFGSCGNMEEVPIIKVYNPLVSKNSKLVGYFTLNKKSLKFVSDNYDKFVNSDIDFWEKAFDDNE